jgi:hypothetical protein
LKPSFISILFGLIFALRLRPAPTASPWNYSLHFLPPSSLRESGNNHKESLMIRTVIQVVFLVASLPAVSLMAQTFRGGVAGTVIDATGAAVAGAAVKLVSPDTGLTREGISSSTGEFVFQDLPLGNYDITVAVAGFETIHVSGVVVDAGRIATVGLKL